MKKIISIIFIFLITNLANSALRTVPSPYTLADAISNSSSGDIIEITDGGTYKCTITIQKTNIIIQGKAGVAKPTIWHDADFTYVFNMPNEAKFVTLKNLKIIAKNLCNGGVSLNGYANTIYNCDIIAEQVANCYYGINSGSGTNLKVIKCTINNFKDAGIRFEFTPSYKLFYNIINNSETGITIDGPGGGSGEFHIYNNTIIRLSI